MGGTGMLFRSQRFLSFTSDLHGLATVVWPPSRGNRYHSTDCGRFGSERAAQRDGLLPINPRRCQVIRLIRCFLRNDRGATAIEYAIIASGIALAIVASVVALGTQVNSMFASVATAFE